MLNIPPKLLPLITKFNDYKYFVIEGGRGSAKTQSVGRVILYISEKNKVRVVCGREVQNTIEDSVHAVLSDLINENDLDFSVKTKKITSRISKSEFKFKGFRERGSINIKGLEGVHIVWIDEAQAMTSEVLKVLLPTIRKENSKLIFTMNRYMRDDAVINEIANRPDCLHIKINYVDNPHCPLTLKMEAEALKNRNRKEFNHVWMGEPLAQADDYLFNYDKLQEAIDRTVYGKALMPQRVMGIDFAAQGNDQCCATILDRVSNQHWKMTEKIPWDEPDTMISTGKIVALMGEHKPDVTAFDIGGLGKPVYDRLNELNVKNLFAFDGASTEGVDTKRFINLRAKSYFKLKDWFDDGFLVIQEKDKDILLEAEKIKFLYNSNGSKKIQSKIDMKKELGYSPDKVDSLMMAVYAATTHLGKHKANSDTESRKVIRKTSSRRKR